MNRVPTALGARRISASLGAVAVILGIRLTFSGSSDGSVVSGATSQAAGTIQTMSGSVGVYGTARHEITSRTAGEMTLTLVWDDGAIDLDLRVTPPCGTLYQAIRIGCELLATSTAPAGTMESISRQVVAGERFTVFVDNVDFNRESNYVLTVALP